MAAAALTQLLERAESRAAEDADFAALLASLLDAPPGAAGDYTRIAAGRVNQGRRRDALQAFKDAALPTVEVQRLLGYGTPQAVHRLRSRGKLIGVQLGNATWFPAWQFADGRIRPELPRLLEMLTRFTTDAVAADRVMRLRREDLGGLSIAASLDRPRLAAAALAALAELAA